MIIKYISENTIIPHHQNILEICHNTPIIQDIIKYNPIILGGFPMALLFAPRAEDNLLQIQPGYYGDFDIYAHSYEDLRMLRFALDRLPNQTKPPIVTDRAVSYTFKKNNQYYGLQLITFQYGKPEDLLEHFDFVNCAVGITPKTETIYFHKDAILNHLNKKLEILDPWMLQERDSTNKQILKYVIIQMIRFKKYCYRWDYTLSDNSFLRLMQIYYQNPDIQIEKDFAYGEGSDELPVLGRKDQNLWSAMACLLNTHPLWKDCNDPHGWITNGSKQFEITADSVLNGKWFEPISPEENSGTFTRAIKNLVRDYGSTPKENISKKEFVF